MKILMLFFLAMSSSALAGGPSAAQHPQGARQSQQSQLQQNQSSASQASVETNGNSQSITLNLPAPPAESTATVNQVIRQEGQTTSNIVHSGTQTVRNVPSVNGPPLTSSNDTCMGSVSGSLSVTGLGLSGAKTVIDTNCVMLKNSRELWNYGMKAAALARMCQDNDNKEALEITGYICPQTERANRLVAERRARGEPEQPHITDDIVRARMGLSPIR